MSKIEFDTNPGRGTFKFVSPGGSTNRTLTLPDKDGTLATTETGKVINVWVNEKTDTWSKSGWGFSDVTGLSRTITPKSASSKFMIHIQIWSSSNYWGTYFHLNRNGTNLGLGTASGSRPTNPMGMIYDKDVMNNHGVIKSCIMRYVDSPNTTGTVTYKVTGSGRAPSYTTYVNRSSPDRNTTEYDHRMASRMIITELEE